MAVKLRIIWWNVHNFAHFELSRSVDSRWPVSKEEFEAKLDRLCLILKDNIGDDMCVVALAEVTKMAAESLRDRILPNHKVLSMDLLDDPEFQCAIIYPNTKYFEEVVPFVVDNVPRGTRPMAVLDYVWLGHRLRIIACHWTARFKDDSSKWRSEIARSLSRYVFDYLYDRSDLDNRHLIIVGDMNEEPFGILEDDLFAVRDRARSRKSKHWADGDVKRKYLYNASWRFLGERLPHGASGHNTAGTYYWTEEKKWKTLDHIIVDGSLVSGTVPSLNEVTTGVISHPLAYGFKSLPVKFSWDGTSPVGGASDHLPILATLNLT
jgi:endonuclease/exonuclease/phosphatase family metal-dependent hydrolase